MTKPPQGVIFTPTHGPVPPRAWGNFCSLSDAQTMVATLNAAPAIVQLGLKFGVPFVDPEQDLAYQVEDPQQPDQIWGTQGNDSMGRLIIVDPIGSFIDRQKYPTAEDIFNSDGSRGGNNIYVKDLGYTVELAWGK